MSSRRDVPAPELTPDGKRKVYVVKGAPFIVDKRYDIHKVLGCGAYGTVCSATDEETGSKVAIKRCSDVFADLIDGKRILREIKVLTSVDHPNVLKLRTVLRPQDPEAFKDVYMVTSLLDADLHHIIAGRQQLVEAHIKTFMAQLLRAVKYLHSANIMHRDIKPANVLVTAKCDIVLCDFGLARTADDETLTQHVATRWYRAPELLVLSPRYAFPVDLWACGCVMGELLLRRPMFQGTNYLNQLQLVLAFIGTPKEDELGHLAPEAQKFLRGLDQQIAMDPYKAFPQAKPAAVEMMMGMLRFDPKKRLTAASGLQHPYIAKLSKPELEPDSPHQHHFTMDEEDYTEATLRKAFNDLIERILSGADDVLLASSVSSRAA